jgi:hypothetical protein
MTRFRKGNSNNGEVTQWQKDATGAFVRPKAKEPAPEFKLEEFLFDKQLKFVRDPRPFKVAVCSRRAGKTIACAGDLIETALLYANTVCLYITLSRNSAKKIVWPELKKINSKYDLKGVEDMVELSITFPNGSVIYCSGAKDASEIEKFRGLALKKVYIDECQSFRAHLKELIDDVLVPALMDYDGSLILIGTPGPVPAGYFAEVSGAAKRERTRDQQEDADTDDADFAWVPYGWTFFDNPHIALKSKKTHQQVLNRALKLRGVAITDPSIQREFFGKWVMDSNSLWIKYDSTKNHYAKLPILPEPHKWNYILGIDIGFNDADALAVIAWSETTPTVYLVEEIVTPGQDMTNLVAQINYLSKKYPIAKMVMDEGGLGKKMAEEMRRRHHIPVHPADKARKQENVTFLNDALRTGRFMAKDGSKFAQDSMLVEVDWDKSTPDRIRVSDKYHSDIIDAVLYAFKESPAFTYTPPEDKPKPGTREWAEQQEQDMFEAAQAHFAEQADIERRINGIGYDD